MALSDFFRINLPYGLKRNEEGKWLVFNREYIPIGFGDINFTQSIHYENQYTSIPVNNPYPKLDAEFIEKLIALGNIYVEYDSNQTPKYIFLYNDGTNPLNNPKGWTGYFQKIKLLSQLKVYESGKFLS